MKEQQNGDCQGLGEARGGGEKGMNFRDKLSKAPRSHAERGDLQLIIARVTCMQRCLKSTYAAAVRTITTECEMEGCVVQKELLFLWWGSIWRLATDSLSLAAPPF